MRDFDSISIACEFCGAPKGQGCKTSGGHARRPHSDRTRPLRDAWWIGYRAGQGDLIRSPEWYERERRRWIEKEGQP